MKENRTGASAFKEKKSISIAAIIVCFLVACGIWLYAQATDDAIYTKTFNQIPVVVDEAGLNEFNQVNDKIAYDSLSAQFASVSIRGTTRELAKIDAQNIRLSVDIRSAVDGVATVKAYMVSDNENGERVELKGYEITPAVVTVNVSKEVDCVVELLPTTMEKDGVKHRLSLVDENIKFKVIGLQQEIAKINYVRIRLDLLNYDPNIAGHQQMPIMGVSFMDHNDQELFNNSNPIDGIRYTLPTVMVNVTPVDSESTTEDQNGKS